MPLYITEYGHLAADEKGNVIPAGLEPCVTIQQLAVGATSVASAPFSAGTRFVRLHTDVNCAVEFRANTPGADPTAVAAASQRLPAGATEFFGVRPGYKVAVITST